MEDLVIRARDGDRDAFGALVHATSDRMYAIAVRILRDADLAEDALQGALVTAWRQLPTLRDPARFEAWVRHAGRRIDVEMAPSWTGGCPDVPDRILILFTEAGRDMTGTGREQPGLWRTDKMRIILLDLGDGDVLLVTITARDPADFDGLMAETMPIIESLTFK